MLLLVLKWIGIAIGALVVLVVIVALVGLLLPKGHVASRSVRFGRGTEEIWGLIRDREGQAKWRKGVTVSRLPDRDGKEVWREAQGRWALTMMIEEEGPGRRLVMRIVDQPAFGGTWTWEMEPDGEGCRVTITERGEVYNPIFRVVGLTMDKRKTMDAYLRALGRAVGEEAVLE